MSVALYEFPLCEKVRNYLRLEQLFSQLDEAKPAQSEYQYLHFLDVLFNIMDLVERLDLRTDFVRDIDAHERKLVHWSQHPDIDTEALNGALQTLHRLGSEIKKNKKLGSSLREERFLVSIRQRFSIPGGATCFDLPSLFCWLKQSDEVKHQDMQAWVAQLTLIENSLTMLLSFLREKARFTTINSSNGYYQGTAEEKLELVRIQCDRTLDIYPVVSGSRNRFAVKFMRLSADDGNSTAVTGAVDFQLACC
jgi:cell division protein ZapD